ncbi:hypothetical protein V1477_015526 [Vespula maculifrons]|uniref:Uncharacterized protein n=1 Tax=Vespula maculifrons TaxID=7453 RepID=A0ABD2BGY3_VESMC
MKIYSRIIVFLIKKKRKKKIALAILQSAIIQIIDFYNHLKTFGTPCSFDYRIFCDCSKLVSAVVVAFAVVVAVAVARILQVVDPGRDRATKCTRPEVNRMREKEEKNTLDLVLINISYIDPFGNKRSSLK